MQENLDISFDARRISAYFHNVKKFGRLTEVLYFYDFSANHTIWISSTSDPWLC